MSSSKVVLYSYYRSSCAWRVRLALGLKGVQFETTVINLIKDGGQQNTSEYQAINPRKQVPALAVDDKILTQSISILEFIEEKWPFPALLPNDVYERAKPLQNMEVLMSLDEDKRAPWAQKWIHKGFEALEKLLANCAGQYSVGDQLTLADCCLVPQAYNAHRFNVSLKPFPIIERLQKTLEALPVFKQAHPSQQVDCPDK